MTTAAVDDDKHAKFQASANDVSRRWKFYSLLATLLADAYASKGECLMHLTLWSWILHMLYFELSLTTSSPFTVQLFHGPSMSGAWALMIMYFWILIANPNMEFDLAPEGRAVWLVYIRAAWLHISPVIFHWTDIHNNQNILRQAYSDNASNKWLWFWASVGGYFAMGLTWEQVNGDAAGTYNVRILTPELFTLISKALGVISCILAFSFITKPMVLSNSN